MRPSTLDLDALGFLLNRWKKAGNLEKNPHQDQTQLQFSVRQSVILGVISDTQSVLQSLMPNPKAAKPRNVTLNVVT